MIKYVIFFLKSRKNFKISKLKYFLKIQFSIFLKFSFLNIIVTMSSFISNNQNHSNLFSLDRNAIIAKYREKIANFAKMVLIKEKLTSDSESVIKNDSESIKDLSGGSDDLKIVGLCNNCALPRKD